MTDKDVSKPTRKSRIPRILANFAIFIVVVLAAYMMRNHHFQKEAARCPDFMPFTKEGALMYSYALDVASGNAIPEYDSTIGGAKDVKVSEEMSLGLEYFLGWGYRLKNMFGRNAAAMKATAYEDNPDFSSWARFQIRAWISLTAGIIFIWLIILRCPWHLAACGALLYAVAPAAVSRATGQDLIKELFCLPFIALMFMAYAWCLRSPGRIKLILLMAAVFASLANWDMSQLCLLLWLCFEILRIACGGIVNRKRTAIWLCIYASAVVAGLAVPYLRAHSFLMSPAMSVFFPALLAAHLFTGKLPYARRLLVTCAALAGLFILWFLIMKNLKYTENYGHFLSLLIAKLRFHNVKPMDPALLNFDARILWTPALHSANLALTRYLFPAAPWVLGCFLVFGLIPKRARTGIRRGLRRSALPLFMAIVFFILYVFMVRFHVLCIIFLCVAFALVADDIIRRTRRLWARALLYLAAFLALAGEADYSFRLASAGRSYEGEYMAENMELIRWLRESDVRGRTVLAGFTLSPMIKAYCGASIVIQPKFELPETRSRVEEYLNIIYHGTEADFSKFCTKYKVDYYIFDRGYNGPADLYSTRYCANARDIGKQSPVFRMYYKKDRTRLRNFYEIRIPASIEFVSDKYTVFKVIAGDAAEKSENLAIAARIAYKRGFISIARGLAEKAVYADPMCVKARIIYAELFGRAADIDLKKDVATIKSLE